jgi:hypothetical protein
MPIGKTNKGQKMRDDYGKGLISGENNNLDSSQIAVRDEFNRRHPPTRAWSSRTTSARWTCRADGGA